MAKILQFTSTDSPSKLGFERVKKPKNGGPEIQGQLTLFSSAIGKILQMHRDLTPFEQALVLDEQGDERAATIYWKAISEGDSVADAFCNLGILESKASRMAKAFDCFTQALKHDPRHYESHYNLGNLYFESGDYKLARTHYELAVQLQPNFPNVFFNLGLVNAINEDFGAAVDALMKYKELVPPKEGAKADELLATLKRSLEIKKR